MAKDTIMGTKNYIGKVTIKRVKLREACVCERDAPNCVRIRIWPVRRDDSSCVLIGAAGLWRSDWRRRKCGRSDWPECVKAFGVRASSDRKHARKD